jgi:hypothetical protein
MLIGLCRIVHRWALFAGTHCRASGLGARYHTVKELHSGAATVRAIEN